ncbi:MAG: class I SAM-dependent methyltransferase [Bacteroidota bacterium]|nr:class I SAM-dependent methyltransferase [Bacteroidota bacterium]
MAKDIFSLQSVGYAKYRPGYPHKIFEFLSTLAPSANAAWDVGTGNGQVAVGLSAHFKEVLATDLSGAQIENAVRKGNITYLVEPGEECSFASDRFDLITVGQALHWFDLDRFYPQVIRTLKAGGIFAALGYGLIQVNPQVDQAVSILYREILGAFWDPERTHVENHYRTIRFPFKSDMREFSIKANWDLEDLTGYLNTWSSVRHYIDRIGSDPVAEFKGELRKAWGKGPKQIYFPVFMKYGKKVG